MIHLKSLALKILKSIYCDSLQCYIGCGLVLELISHLDGKFPGVKEDIARINLLSCNAQFDITGFRVVIFPSRCYLRIKEKLIPFNLDFDPGNNILFGNLDFDFRGLGIVLGKGNLRAGLITCLIGDRQFQFTRVGEFRAG